MADYYSKFEKLKKIGEQVNGINDYLNSGNPVTPEMKQTFREQASQLEKETLSGNIIKNDPMIGGMDHVHPDASPTLKKVKGLKKRLEE